MLNACGSRTKNREAGAAMIAAIALVLLASFVMIAIMVSSNADRDATRERVDLTTGEALARDAGTALAAMYDGLEAGEHNGFVPDGTALERHAVRLGGRAVANSSLPGAVRTVDARVPDRARFAVEIPLEDGRVGSWQVLSLLAPDWGVTRGGIVTVYVRTWSASSDSPELVTQPQIFKLRLRPTWFADFQMVADGPMSFQAGAEINGRIHSNGFRASFFNMYDSQAQQVAFEGAPNCGTAARITTTSGSIDRAGTCVGSKVQEDVATRVNLLRGRETIARLRRLCATPGAVRTIALSCLPTQTEIAVTLAGDRVVYPGGSLDARVLGRGSDQNQGAVLVTSGDVRLRGALGSRARATIVTGSPVDARSYGDGGAPSIRILDGGSIGSTASDPTSSVGLVAEGDVMFDERTACPVSLSAAMLTMSGMVSMRQNSRVPYPISDASMCGSQLVIRGSIASHFPPILRHDINGGYQNRSYRYNEALFNNPPPLYPTAADWQVVSSAVGNVDCFRAGSGTYTLDLNRGDCA